MCDEHSTCISEIYLFKISNRNEMSLTLIVLCGIHVYVKEKGTFIDAQNI